MIVKNFASDNNSGVHPKIMQAILNVNTGHVVAYGEEKYTENSIQKFKENFGENIDVYFVFNGTSANVLGLKTITNSYNAIICAETSHINVDECNAPEKFTDCKLLTIKSKNGKINIEDIEYYMHGFGDPHHTQPKVISITQSTEMGTVYSVNEIKSLSDFAHKNNMYLHMDGARISNACVSLNKNLREITTDLGVDVLSFGGTKNGMMYGEAVIFFDKKLSENFKFFRKQGMQLSSKMRFISAQFEALLSNDLWRINAENSNKMAKLLYEQLNDIPKIKITQKVESNAIFAIVPREYIKPLQEKYFFHVWDEKNSEVRFMTTYDTTKEDIYEFTKFAKEIVK